MSIIHDALKKVQEKSAQDAPRPGAEEQTRSTPFTSTPARPRLPKTPFRPAVFCAMAILVSISGAFLLLHPAPKISPSLLAPTAVPKPEPAAASTAVALPQPPTTPPSALKIEGIMDMGAGKNVALINGNIYEQGQIIDGKVIAEITVEQVILIDHGTKIALPINSQKR